MNTPAKPKLRLRLDDVDEADADKVSAFLRIGQSRLRADWAVVTEGSAHVVLAGNDRAAEATIPREPPLAILRMVDRLLANREAGALARPLQYEALIEALLAVEALALSEDAPPNVPAGAALAVLAPVRTRKLATPVRSIKKAAKFAPDSAFRLKRWPPASVLGAHRYYTRLASFLSTRPVSLDELVRLSNVAPHQCEGFLIALAATGLLDITPLATRPVNPRSGMAASAPSKTSAPTRHVDNGGGLFSKFRRTPFRRTPS